MAKGNPNRVSSGLFLALIHAALFTVLGRHWIATQYSQDPLVIALAAQLMLFAAVYQLSDTIQVVSSGALRGYKDTKVIFFITMVAYWGLGLPTGVILGLTDWFFPKWGRQASGSALSWAFLVQP